MGLAGFTMLARTSPACVCFELTSQIILDQVSRKSGRLHTLPPGQSSSAQPPHPSARQTAAQTSPVPDAALGLSLVPPDAPASKRRAVHQPSASLERVGALAGAGPSNCSEASAAASLFGPATVPGLQHEGTASLMEGPPGSLKLVPVQVGGIAVWLPSRTAGMAISPPQLPALPGAPAEAALGSAAGAHLAAPSVARRASAQAGRQSLPPLVQPQPPGWAPEGQGLEVPAVFRPLPKRVSSDSSHVADLVLGKPEP